MKTKFEKCYMCDKEGYTREHVPPRCLFPEQKDVVIDLRQNLLTVPSCPDHNSKKSNNDEFFMMTISGIVGNNDIGYLHYHTKVQRSLARKPKFIEKIVKNLVVTEHVTEDGKLIPVLKGQLDIKRIESCLTNIVHGLYYYEFNRRMKRKKLKFVFSFLIHSNEKSANFVQFLKERFVVEPKKSEMIGSNPEVFYYQTVPADEYGIILFKLVFYEFTEFYVSIIPEDFDADSTLLGQLFSANIPIVITLGEKEFIVK